MSNDSGSSLRALARDTTWAETHRPLELSLATFGILALELAIIRWSGGQVRVLAYFQNLILISAFLGIGLGVGLGRRFPGLVHFALPGLAVPSLLLAFAEPLGITHLRFSDSSLHLWGAEVGSGGMEFAITLSIVLLLFWSIAGSFVLAGSAVGHLFGRMRTLRAYGYDLLGSLLGVIAIAAITGLQLGPHYWLGLGAVPLALLSRRLPALVGLVVILAAAWASVGDALYSPYNRLDLVLGSSPGATIGLSANRDFHQLIHDLSDEALARAARTGKAGEKRRYRSAYDLPFVLGDERGRALVVAAGTGNDVQAALRNGFDEVYSVDIDPTILEIGRLHHPERPYSDPRVVAVANDARAFFEQYDGPRFDVVCYGLLDSHTMFSAMSSLRLESFVYTVEGIRSAWELVGDDGLLSISFSTFAGDWIADRLYWTIAEATGREPIMIGPTIHYGTTYVVARRPESVSLDRARPFSRTSPTARRDEVRITTDDWPFLYLKPGQFPWGYVLLLTLVLAGGLWATQAVYGRGLLGGALHLPLFFMGAAFMLLETRGVTTLSLLFGSTWLVNAAVFGGVLFMALVANLLVDFLAPRKNGVWFLLLFASLVLLLLLDLGTLNRLPLLWRGTLGAMLIGLPVGFAGVLVSMILDRSKDGAMALGSNLLGALVGGCLEYLSIWLGLDALTALAFLLYATAYALLRRGGSSSEPAVAASPAP